MLGLGAHGVHHDQWRTRSARQVAQPALAFVTLPGRVEEMGTRARDPDRRFGAVHGLKQLCHRRLLSVGPLGSEAAQLRAGAGADAPSDRSSGVSSALAVGWAGSSANAIRAPAAATPAAT
jgi:hypothetical protein